MPYQKKCAVCEKDFLAKRPYTKFCGPACYREGMRRLNRARSRDIEYREKKMYPAARRWLRKKA